MLIECGGDGQCGPNVLSFLLGLLRFYAGDGAQLRREIVGYVRTGLVLNTRTQFAWIDAPEEYLTCQELMLENMKRWPPSTLQGREPSVELWCHVTEELHAWTDLTFLQLCASRFGTAIQLVGVDDVGKVEEMMMLLPTDGSKARALVFVGCWYAQHFIAIVDISSAPPQQRAGAIELALETAGDTQQNDRLDGNGDPHQVSEASSSDLASASRSEGITESDGPPETVQLEANLSACVVLLYITILMQPLVYAHMNGLTALGVMLPTGSPKSFAASWVRRACRAFCSARTLSFLVGVSATGLRLYAAPIAYAPDASSICSSSEQRRGWLQRGVRFAWCTLAAL